MGMYTSRFLIPSTWRASEIKEDVFGRNNLCVMPPFSDTRRVENGNYNAATLAIHLTQNIAKKIQKF